MFHFLTTGVPLGEGKSPCVEVMILAEQHFVARRYRSERLCPCHFKHQFFLPLSAAMKRSSPEPAGSSDHQQLPIVPVPPRKQFTIVGIPIIGRLLIEIPNNEPIDSLKQQIVNELYARQGVTLRRSQFCLTQRDSRVDWQAPSSAVDTGTPLKLAWSIKEQDRPMWSYTAWYDPSVE